MYTYTLSGDRIRVGHLLHVSSGLQRQGSWALIFFTTLCFAPTSSADRCRVISWYGPANMSYPLVPTTSSRTTPGEAISKASCHRDPLQDEAISSPPVAPFIHYRTSFTFFLNLASNPCLKICERDLIPSITQIRNTRTRRQVRDIHCADMSI
ncbi:hypothetical protein F5I97DRAFT_1092185 [Phlebopus sp. FC_14]|nr:hypothetical protein F5I97DRAFT_1092185 [Phlebopus sp. FC_14]